MLHFYVIIISSICIYVIYLCYIIRLYFYFIYLCYSISTVCYVSPEYDVKLIRYCPEYDVRLIWPIVMKK